MAYDINYLLELYDQLELDLIKRMKAHITAMKLDGVKRSEIKKWEAAQRFQMMKFKYESKKIIAAYRRQLRGASKETMREILIKAQEKELNRIIKFKKYFPKLSDKLLNVDFNSGIDDRRLTAVLDAVYNDTNKSMSSLYRQVNDVYRKTVFNAALKYSTGQELLTKCVDEAQKEFLKKGIADVTYKNGNKVNIRSYAEMALRTNAQRAAIAGEAILRDQLETYYVRVSSHGITCEMCAPWQGQILIDDVYQNGKPDGKHKMLSEAMRQGLLHPNCRHMLRTVDPDVDGDSRSISYTKKDREQYKAEQTQRRYERDIRAKKRLMEGAVNPDDYKEYRRQLTAAQKTLRDFIDENEFLTRQYNREKI